MIKILYKDCFKMLFCLLVLFLSASRTSAQTHVPHPAFRAYLNAEFNIEFDKAHNITNLKSTEGIKKFLIDDRSRISDLTGIEAFSDLEELTLYPPNPSTPLITAINLASNLKLQKLILWRSNLTVLDLSNNTSLRELYIESFDCTDCGLKEIDLSQNTLLEVVSLLGQKLDVLDVSNNTLITHLSLGGNRLESIDVSNNSAITELQLSRNQLKSLDVTNNRALQKLGIGNNQLSSLDLSNNTSLIELYASENLLTSLDLSTTGLNDGNYYGLSTDDIEIIYDEEAVLARQQKEQDYEFEIQENLKKTKSRKNHYGIINMILFGCYVIGLLFLMVKKDTKKKRNIILNILILVPLVAVNPLINIGNSFKGYDMGGLIYFAAAITAIIIHFTAVITKIIVLRKQRATSTK